MPVTSEQATRTGDQLSRLGGEVAGIFRRAWGRGPVKTTAHWAGSEMLVLLLENGHTDAEKALRAAGHIQQLLAGRRLLQQIVEDDLRTCVERIIGRPVVTVLSATRLDPDLSAEVFLLGHADTGDEQRADAPRGPVHHAVVGRGGELQDEASAVASQTRRFGDRAGSDAAEDHPKAPACSEEPSWPDLGTAARRAR